MTNRNERDREQEDARLLQLYRDLGSPNGDTPAGLAGWLAERLARVNQDRRNPTRKGEWGGPINDPRIRRGS